MKADQVIVDEVKAGNKSAFGELVERHQRVLMRVALRLTKDLESAEDVVQDSFIKAYEKIHLFEGRSSFKSWLYRIAINTAKNKLREYKRVKISMEKVELIDNLTAEHEVVKISAKDLVNVEIELLPEKQKLALKLRIFEELSFKEIADVMACPYDTAKANYRHALLKLRDKFEGSEDLMLFKNLNFRNGSINHASMAWRQTEADK